MSESCNHNCESCSENCSQRTAQSFLEPLHPQSSVKKVIGVVSGKGGVGKSLVTSLTACGLRARGHRVGILDADITGPSIPKAFGLHGTVHVTDDQLMLPAESATGIQALSSNLILDHETDPVIWRGPIVGGVIKQFWSEALWKDIDYMLVDMPPGTGDVPLTVFQSLPLNGIIIVTSPQELVSMIVAKAVNMARKMDIPILGLVENMSYLECPDCKKRISVFGESRVEETAKEYGIPVLAKIPIDPKIADAVDQGAVEYIEAPWLAQAVDAAERV
ncbi:Mrp/NBP35 family ATP-binding protein [Otoolea muris]|uniref:Mrp/NBP35 family ATP-binding protein n=1 Tax=Otoolea muris TaxID=2941515 RepID=UPI002041F4BF|nr:Mrp/NBP35 family ATP-binding protein [Otoolea muris]